MEFSVVVALTHHHERRPVCRVRVLRRIGRCHQREHRAAQRLGLRRALGGLLEHARHERRAGA